MEKSSGVLVLILISVMLSVGGQLAMKVGATSLQGFSISSITISGIIELISNPMLILGLALYGIASLFWLAVLSRAELSYAYPMIAISYVVAAIIAWLLFKENLTLFRFLGITLIIGGVYLISLKR